MNKPTRLYKRITEHAIFWWQIDVHGFTEASYLIETSGDLRGNMFPERRTIHTREECLELATLRIKEKKAEGYFSPPEMGAMYNDDGSISFLGQNLSLEEMIPVLADIRTAFTIT